MQIEKEHDNKILDFSELELKNYIDSEILVYREYDAVYFLNSDIKKGSMLFEERDNFVILWADDLVDIQREEVYPAIARILKTTVIFPYVDTAEDRDFLLGLGARKIDFTENQEDFSQEFGSYALG